MTVLTGKNTPSFSYPGIINATAIRVILRQIEEYLSPLYVDTAAKRKIIAIAIELLQNIHHHGPVKDSSASCFEIKRREEGFELVTTNLIEERDVDSLKNRIDYLNTLSLEELNTYYRGLLKNGSHISENAGLGLVEIRRKSNNPILYKFVPQDNIYYLFTVIVLV